ncbi:MAG: Ornithine carbamoyltransferase, partial [uncultured Solirubrobacteraceae bacterium]
VQPAQPQLPQGDRLLDPGARAPARARADTQAGQVRRHRDAVPARQGDRAHLREDLDAHARGVRGRSLRPGRPRDLPRPRGLADRPQGVDRRHGARARPALRRHRVPRRGARHDRGAGRSCRRPGLQRPHRRVAPHPDAGRLPDHARGRPQALPGARLLLHGRRPQQHGPLAAGDGRDHGQRRAHLRARGAAPTGGRGGGRARARHAKRGSSHADRGPRRSAARRRLRAHRRLGLAGREQGRLARARRAALALPGQPRRAAKNPQPPGPLHALPARLSRHEHGGRARGDRADRHVRRARGHQRSIRIPRQHRLRPSREPPAHHQGRARRHDRRRV